MICSGGIVGLLLPPSVLSFVWSGWFRSWFVAVPAVDSSSIRIHVRACVVRPGRLLVVSDVGVSSLWAERLGLHWCVPARHCWSVTWMPRCLACVRMCCAFVQALTWSCVGIDWSLT
eukprot:4469032-Prorocentrum_lima.AAC.1